jgi:hypothetical protein
VLCTHGFRWFDSPGSPAHFVSQAGSLVTRRVLVADATLKRPKDFFTSSTEAEFIAAVSAAKAAKYLRAILLDLGFLQSLPTPIYIDNASAIQIINARRPTDRSRHIDIQAFAIQDWKDNGDILMHHIPFVINPSDSLTKPTGWILHSRHCRRLLMGHFSA